MDGEAAGALRSEWTLGRVERPLGSGKTKRVAWMLFGVAAALLVAGEVLAILNLASARSSGWGTIGGRVASGPPFGIAYFSFAVVGVLVATRRPGNAVAWLCLAGAAVAMCDFFVSEYAYYGLRISRDSLPGASWLVWVGSWVTPVWVGLFVVYMVLLFPDGRLPFRLSRPVAWLGALAIFAVALPAALIPGPMQALYSSFANPFGVEGAGGLLNAIRAAGHALLPACSVAAAVTAIFRFRRATGDERLQLKWFVTAVLFGAAIYVGYSLARASHPQTAGVLGEVGTVATLIIASAVAIAILKFRLYDIDLVISKALVFTVMAGFITAAYVGIVVGLGGVLGSAQSRPSIGLSILATAVVAVGFQPVLDRAKRFANRLVYGKRATPYEVLAKFSDRVAETYATEDVLPKMARMIAEGTGARRAGVWLRSGEELRLAASWPDDSVRHEPPVELEEGLLPGLSTVDRAVAVRHQDKLLGAITIVKPPGEPLSSTEEKLLSDLASQAGLVLRNVGLTSELVARLQELMASRQRLIVAQDEARRRLERNLHDGAQQHLVSLRIRLNLAARMAAANPQLKETLESLQTQAAEALEGLRELAHGIYPPLLAEQGLQAALRSQTGKLVVPVEIDADGLPRYPQDIEAAVYFCCLEALQNVVKYAGADLATVLIVEAPGHLRFSVRDNGLGFDRASTSSGSGLQNMGDRLAALGGTLEVRSAPGQGTTIVGDVPTENLRLPLDDCLSRPSSAGYETVGGTVA